MGKKNTRFSKFVQKILGCFFMVFN